MSHLPWTIVERADHGHRCYGNRNLRFELFFWDWQRLVGHWSDEHHSTLLENKHENCYSCTLWMQHHACIPGNMGVAIATLPSYIKCANQVCKAIQEEKEKKHHSYSLVTNYISRLEFSVQFIGQQPASTITAIQATSEKYLTLHYRSKQQNTRCSGVLCTWPSPEYLRVSSLLHIAFLFCMSLFFKQRWTSDLNFVFIWNKWLSICWYTWNVRRTQIFDCACHWMVGIVLVCTNWSVTGIQYM